jgi:hypothetical protein
MTEITAENASGITKSGIKYRAPSGTCTVLYTKLKFLWTCLSFIQQKISSVNKHPFCYDKSHFCRQFTFVHKNDICYGKIHFSRPPIDQLHKQMKENSADRQPVVQLTSPKAGTLEVSRRVQIKLDLIYIKKILRMSYSG